MNWDEVIYLTKAQPQLCLFFNEVAERWGEDFPPKRRGLDT